MYGHWLTHLKGLNPLGVNECSEKKMDTDGKVETYKVRLIVKEYRQLYGIDYDKTFFSVIMLKSIRIMLAIAVHLDYEI